MQHKTLRVSFHTACQLVLLLVLLALGSAQAEESGDIIQAEKMRPLRKFVMMPIDPEGLPPGHGDAFQRELTQAFQKRFGSVKGFDLKALSSHPDLERMHPRNKKFWAEVSQRYDAEAFFYVKNEMILNPSFIEKSTEFDPIFGMRERVAPTSAWRVILLARESGEILWNMSLGGEGKSALLPFGELGTDVKDTYKDIATLIAHQWPFDPQEMNVNDPGLKLGALLPQSFYDEEHIFLSGVGQLPSPEKTMEASLKVVFPSDVKKLAGVICLPVKERDIWRLRFEWYAPGKKLVQDSHVLPDFSDCVEGHLKVDKKAGHNKLGRWELKIFHKDKLLDHQAFCVGEISECKE